MLSGGLLAQRPHGKVEFRDDQDDAPGQAPVGAPRPGPGFPGELVCGAALDFPRVAHADVGEADHAPAEEGEEGGEVGEPAKDFGAAWGGVSQNLFRPYQGLRGEFCDLPYETFR